MEEIPSLLNTACKQIAAIAKAVSEFVKTNIYPLNPDVFNEEDFISGEVPLQGARLCKWIDLAQSEEVLTPVMKGMPLAPMEAVTAAEKASLLL
jgi:hypothetical protein